MFNISTVFSINVLYSKLWSMKMDTGYNTYMCVNFMKNGINEKD